MILRMPSTFSVTYIFFETLFGQTEITRTREEDTYRDIVAIVPIRSSTKKGDKYAEERNVR